MRPLCIIKKPRSETGNVSLRVESYISPIPLKAEGASVCVCVCEFLSLSPSPNHNVEVRSEREKTENRHLVTFSTALSSNFRAAPCTGKLPGNYFFFYFFLIFLKSFTFI